MENSTPTKTCETCSRYERYYTKGTTKFERTEFGYCIEKQKIVENTPLRILEQKNKQTFPAPTARHALTADNFTATDRSAPNF